MLPATTIPKSIDAKNGLLHLYQMLLIRRFEERAGQLYGLGLIGGFCHLYIGQEAVAVLPGDDAESLAARILAAEHRLYPSTIGRLLAGEPR